MKTGYGYSKNTDAYAAGLEIADSLQSIEPELVILFASINYDFKDLFNALYSVLSREKTLVWGGTGDGVYCPGGVFHFGISAIGINSQGAIRWRTAVRDGAEDPELKTLGCLDEIRSNQTEPVRAGLVLADFQNDGVKICAGLNREPRIPFVGGLCGDDWQFQKGLVFLNGECYENAVTMLGMEGEVYFDCHVASGWKPIGRRGVVKSSSGNVVRFIDDSTAYEYMEEEFGLPPAEAELGVVPFAAYTDAELNNFFLRTSSRIDMNTGEITFFGSIAEGTVVQVCNATRKDVLEGVEQVIAALRQENFKPRAAVIVSCGGRKWVLQEEVSQEILRFQRAFGEDFPVTGFASFGEIGPFKQGFHNWSDNYFHNVSYAVMLIGERQ